MPHTSVLTTLEVDAGENQQTWKQTQMWPQEGWVFKSLKQQVENCCHHHQPLLALSPSRPINTKESFFNEQFLAGRGYGSQNQDTKKPGTLATVS